ncbi:MAG: imelysin family protein [Bacteroidota bacterium]
MTKFLKRYGIGAIAALGILTSCRDEPTNTPDVNFDRKAMFQNIADNIIVPEYSLFKTKVLEMDAALNDFAATPNPANLQAAREKFQTAYLAWQRTSAFEIGPANSLSLRSNLNTFPTNINLINNNIQSGAANLDVVSNWAAKGFPAIEFMLYGAGAEADVVKLFTTDADALKRIQYLKVIMSDIKQKVVTVHGIWMETFRNDFINNTGTDKGSSLGELVNQLNFDWEVIKNPKLGIPVGIKTLGEPLPKNVEAYYSGKSLELALENSRAILNLYKGGNGLGLDDYLNAYNAKHGNTTLDAAIQAQMTAAISALEAIPGPLSEAVINNKSGVEKAYQEFQKAVVLLKADMPSILGVMISYTDADGD